MKEAESLLQKYNGNAEEAFKAKAKEMGVDPEEILGILK